MNEKYRLQLQELAASLVRPERYGAVALQDTAELEPVAARRLHAVPSPGPENSPPPDAA